MAGRINNNNVAFWPWPANVREKIVERNQIVDRKKGKKGKVGDPRNPPLASAALLEFMGPGHSSEELRLPMLVSPRQGDGRNAESSGLLELQGLLERGDAAQTQVMTRELQRIGVPAERLERLKALLQREAGMLELMGRLSADVEEIQARIKDEQKTRGY
jgi:hypothetical protein